MAYISVTAKKAIGADWSGLERTGADIGTEAFYPVVYCGRIDYSGNCANRKISIGSDGNGIKKL